MSYYNASPHHRYRHRLPLRLLLRLQVSKQDVSTREHSLGTFQTDGAGEQAAGVESPA